jgi:hypothetical protein
MYEISLERWSDLSAAIASTSKLSTQASPGFDAVAGRLYVIGGE